MTTRSASPLLPILVAALTACGEGSARANAAAVRDSAGVRIVESTAPAWEDGEGWRIPADPTLNIGMAEGAPAYMFGQVADAIRLSDGRIVVADRQANELRFFDREGRHLRTTGRAGGGPGEFQSLQMLVHLPGDSVGAWDLRAARLSVFGPDGEFVRERTLKPAEGRALLRLDGAFADGSLLVAPFGGVDRDQDSGATRDTVPVFRYAAEGSGVDTVGRFPGEENVTIQGAGSSGRWMIRGAVPFGRNTFRAARGDELYVADSERLAVAVYGTDGKLRRVARAAHEPEALTPEEVARYKEEQLASAGAGDEGEMTRRLLEATPFPQTKSAFAAMQVDAGGAVWLRGHTVGGDEPARWTVFDADGRLLGTVQAPAGFRVTEIGEDYVLGVWSDDLDVQHVRLYALEKPRT